MKNTRRPSWMFPVCAAVLLAAMGLRVFGMMSSGGEAFAQQPAEKTAKKAEAAKAPVPVEVMEPQAAQNPGESGETIKPAQVVFSPGEIEALQQLAARRDEIGRRSAALDGREATLQAAEARLDKKTQELEALKAQINALLDGEKQKENSRLGSLVKVYESMKPKEAARIFETLEPDVLLCVASRMKEAKLAAVLAALSPDKARDITTTLVLNPAE